MFSWIRNFQTLLKQLTILCSQQQWGAGGGVFSSPHPYQHLLVSSWILAIIGMKWCLV